MLAITITYTLKVIGYQFYRNKWGKKKYFYQL